MTHLLITKLAPNTYKIPHNAFTRPYLDSFDCWYRSIEEEYQIPVVYKNQQVYFKATIINRGIYTEKIRMEVNGTEVTFQVDKKRVPKLVQPKEKQ